MAWTFIMMCQIMLVKFALDGFSVARFFQQESHFQFGYSIVRLGENFQSTCNSRRAFRPIAKTIDKEEIAIPLVCAIFDKDMSARATHVQEDGSLLIKLGHQENAADFGDIEYMQPIFVSDQKAALKVNGRMTAAANYFCPYCKTHRKQVNNADHVKRIPCTTRMGDFRALARVRQMGDKKWKEIQTKQLEALGHARTPASLELRPLGSGVNGNFIQEDWKNACGGQETMPLLTFVPDNVKISNMFPIECLHLVIQCLNHRFDHAVKIGATTEHGSNAEVLISIPMDACKVLPEGLKRPMLGYSGQKLWKMLEKPDEWVPAVLGTVPQDIIYCGGKRYTQGTQVVHPRQEEYIQSIKDLHYLLKIAFKVKPTEEEIWTYGEKAEAHGRYMRAHFPEYTFKNYDHFLVCHLGEQMEYFGGIGALSSIVCEAANAEWKDIIVNHSRGYQPGDNGLSASALQLYAAATHPEVYAGNAKIH
jgi:hypothetical protein